MFYAQQKYEANALKPNRLHQRLDDGFIIHTVNTQEMTWGGETVNNV